MIFPIIVFIISFIALLWSGKILPKALGTISRGLRISEFVAAFILASFATSIPELFVGVSAALQGIPDLSIGSIIGSNIANITLVIGLSILIGGKASMEGKISVQNYWLITFISFLPLALLIDGDLSRIDGLILIASFILYIKKLLKDKEHFRKKINDDKEEGSSDTSSEILSLSKVMPAFGKFIVGTGFLLASSIALVWSSKLIVGAYFDYNFILFGVVFIALGTSLPELAFGIRASLDKHSSAMLGNALGSVAFNSAGIIGVIALISPIKTDFADNYLTASIFLLASFVLFHFFAYTKKRLDRKEGFFLVALYVLFLFFMF